MLSINQIRLIDGKYKDLSEEEILEVRDACYSFADFAFELFMAEKRVSISPPRFTPKPLIQGIV